MAATPIAYSRLTLDPDVVSPVKKPSVNSAKEPPVRRLPIEKPQHGTRFKRLWHNCVHNWWAWEFLAATLNLFATAALNATLAVTDGRPLQSMTFGFVQISLNAFVAAISTVIRASLLVTVAGPLNQSVWNWFFAPSGKGFQQGPGKPLKDLDIFGNAAQSA